VLAAPPRSSALVLATPPGSVPMGWPRRPRIGNWDGNEQAEPMRFHEPSRHVVWLPSEGYFALPYDARPVHVACIWLGRARAARCARGAPNFFPVHDPWRRKKIAWAMGVLLVRPPAGWLPRGLVFNPTVAGICWALCFPIGSNR